ncbi:hypothetical protein [Cytobacillus sp. NCCP-133]|nr:hypothetical protein [Cytobacillus sp. NCCP-133]
MAMGTSWMFLYEAYAQIGVSIASIAYYCGLSFFTIYEAATPFQNI